MKAFVVAMLVFALLFYGCAGASSQAPPPGKTDSGQPNTTINKGGVLADNKTGYDKTQQTIMQVIADGTYSKEIQYPYHSGVTTVDVSVTVKNDTVTAVSVAGVNPDKMSARIIGNFAAALPDLVVGKKISDIKLPKNVAGSSLTTAVFQQYVDGLVQNHGQA